MVSLSLGWVGIFFPILWLIGTGLPGAGALPSAMLNAHLNALHVRSASTT